MGIGVFADNFNGTGQSFLVAGQPYLMARYRTECELAGRLQPDDEAGACASWADESGISVHEDLTDIIGATLGSLGFPAEAGQDGERATFDSAFTLIGRSHPIEVGLRNWDHENDFVIGVAAEKGRYGDGPHRMIAQPEIHLSELLGSGRIPSIYAPQALSFTEDVAVCIRHALQQAGFECRYPSSTWTTAPYPAVDAATADQAAERVVTTIRYMDQDTDERFRELYATADGRASVIRTVQSIEAASEYRSGEGHLYTWTPYYSPTRDEVILLDPFELVSDRPAWSGGELSISPALIAQFCKAAPEGYLYPIPRDEHTEDWWAGQQAATLGGSEVPYLLVSEAEFTETTGIEVGRWPSADLDEESENDDNSSFRP